MSLSVDTSTQGERSINNALFAKVFLYMFIGLLYTIGVSAALYFILNGVGITKAQSLQTYSIILIVAACVQLVLTFVIMFTTMKHPGSVAALLVPAFLYATCMGVLLTGFTYFLDWATIAGAFGVSSLAFLGMALVGAFSKRNLSGLAFVGCGLLFSVLFAGLFGLIFYFLLPGVWTTLNIVVSVVVIIAVMLITAYDVWNIKKTIEAGQMSSQVALYCAFQLYLDFILILLKVLQLLALTRR